MPQRDSNRRVLRNTALCLLCLLTGATVATVTQVFADNDPATSDVTSGDLIVPYEGYLKVDAAGLDGVVSLRFELFESATGGVAEWSEEQNVTMYNGRFSVGLGAVTQLNATLLDAQRLWLGITVLEDDGQGGVTEVALSGRQSIEPAPYAAWSAHAADFQVAGDLDVAGNALVAADLRVGGSLLIQGTKLRLGGKTALSPQTGDVLGLGEGFDEVQFNRNTVVDGDFQTGSMQRISNPTITGTLSATNKVELDKLTTGEMVTPELVGTRNGLTLKGASTSTGGIEIDNVGNVVFPGDVELFTRKSLQLEMLGSESAILNVNNTGWSGSDSFCYLEGIVFHHRTGHQDGMTCSVKLDANNMWVVESSGQTPQSFTVCRAICRKFGAVNRP